MSWIRLFPVKPFGGIIHAEHGWYLPEIGQRDSINEPGRHMRTHAQQNMNVVVLVLG